MVTRDEDDNGENKPDPNHLRGERQNRRIWRTGNPHNVLSTLEQMYGLNTTGNAATVRRLQISGSTEILPWIWVIIVVAALDHRVAVLQGLRRLTCQVATLVWEAANWG